MEFIVQDSLERKARRDARIDEVLGGLYWAWGYLEAKEMKFGSQGCFGAIELLKQFRDEGGK